MVAKEFMKSGCSHMETVAQMFYNQFERRVDRRLDIGWIFFSLFVLYFELFEM